MMTTSSEKPENALPAGTMPVAIAASRASKATRSKRKRPQTKSPIIQAMMKKARNWGSVMSPLGRGHYW
jgi:hypothetical protein